MGAQRELHPARAKREVRLGERFLEEVAHVLILKHRGRNRQAKKRGGEGRGTTGQGQELGRSLLMTEG